MTENVIPLPKAERKKPAPFDFTKTSLNQHIADLANEKGITLRDTRCRGLALRKQRQDWMLILERKIDGKQWRVVLGSYGPHTDLREVRSRAEAIATEIKDGTYQPRKVKAETRRVEQADQDMSLGGALALHHRVNPRLRPATIEEYARGVLWLVNKAPGRDDAGKADVIGTAGAVSLPINCLTTDMVRVAYDRLCDAGKPASGNAMLRAIRAIWNTWAEEAEVDARNPVERITKKRGRVIKVKPRTGALAPDERKAWYSALERLAKTSASHNTARALQFLFLTGMRRDEVLGLSWAEVDAESLTVPGERMKSGDPLSRPISPALRRILDEQRRMNPNSEWVFPASRGPGRLRDTRKTLAKLPTVITNHDLRRGFIVAAALAGVPEVASKMLVGHSINDITEVYARAIESELPRLAKQVEDELLRGIE